MAFRALIQLRAHARRLLAVALAIMLGIAFLTATLLFGRVLDETFRNTIGSEYRNIDIVVEPVERELTDATVRSIGIVPGVAEVDPRALNWLPVTASPRQDGLLVSNLPKNPDLRSNLHVEEGRLPERAGEIVLLKDAERMYRVNPGETIQLGGAESGTPLADFTVVGTLRGDSRLGVIENQAFMTGDALAALPNGGTYVALHVMAEPGVDQSALAEAIQRELGSSAVATGADTFVDAQIGEYKDSTALMKRALLAFAFVSLVVTGIVISNTFMILIAQRTREIALFRCAGATRSQIRRAVLAEALIVSVIGAVAGVTLAMVLANLGLVIAGRVFDIENLPSVIIPGTGAILFSLLAGVVMTVTAAWTPARAAVGVSPLDALRSAATTVTEIHLNRRRLAAAVVLLSGGGALMALGAVLGLADRVQIGVPIGVIGGAVAFLGALLGTGLFVPRLVSLLGGMSERFGGATARVAAANSLRNPKRTSSTAAALIIGVTLVSMMVVGADSLKAGLAAEVDERATTDLDVGSQGDAESASSLTDRFLDEIAAIDGVAEIASTVSVDGSVAGADNSAALTTRVMAVNPDDARAVWRDTATFESFGPGLVLIPSWIAAEQSIASGDEVTIDVGGRAAQLKASVADSADFVVLSDADAQPLFPGMEPTGLWIALADGADADAVIDAIYEIAEQTASPVYVDAIVDYRGQIEEALDVLLLIVIGLLAVAVAIALLGVGNTLSLSVLERTRESATLRALGFTRRQLRSMLAIEGMLIAGVGGVIGIVLGTAFGWIGALTLTGSEFGIHLGFPALQLLLILAIAVIAGLLASIVPGRAAANGSVVAGLADA